MSTLAQLLQGTPYVSYTYAYPHKTTYRDFPERVPLAELWRHEKRDAVFLYLHVPFCEMRCGFCNLFTTVDPTARFTRGYLAALERQARSVRDAVGELGVVRMALGGGTPTFLEVADLARLFAIAEETFAIRPGSIPLSVETSPLTITPEKLHLLRHHGVDRISIGVQSFVESEVHAAGRPQKTTLVGQALDAIRSLDFPTLNIDLIYGLPGQTVKSWLSSLQAALRYYPEELYLYPLYVRPLTGLERAGVAVPVHEEDIRLACYRAARELLLSEGYTQVSMRMFRAAHAPAETGPVYCVQDDGMVGLGCGARSYTRTHHYSNEYGVGAPTIRSILHAYTETPAEAFAFARYGYVLNEEEQRRRYVLKSLLEAGGLSLQDYLRRFASMVFNDLPVARELLDCGLAVVEDEVMTLTPMGLERSDTIGPWLYSSRARQLTEEYTLR
ncbi:MAG: STM4012 family radical SAM protein [Ktedonobacteraceae bacterium]